MLLQRLRIVAKRYFTLLIIFGFLCQVVFPTRTWAADSNQASSVELSNEPAVSLEKAINIVRDCFTIPQDYTKFTSGLNMYNNSQTWSLNWNSSEQSGGTFSAQVDVNTGEIINMNNWKNAAQPGPITQIPAVQASEAKDIATKLVSRLIGSKMDELQIMPMDDTVIPLVSYGPVSYVVHWQRLINNIPFPNNGVTVQVNAMTGDILSYSKDWMPLKQIPQAKGIINPNRAEECFLNSDMLELQYFAPAPIRPLNSGEKQNVKLVYQLNGSYPSGAIDAMTGEPIKVNFSGYAYGKGGYAGGPINGSAVSNDAKTALNPAEQTEIDKSAKLLRQEEAIAAVKRWVPIPDNLILRGSNLSTEGIAGDLRVWNLNWNGNNLEDQQYMSARVNALTGELLGFSLPYKEIGNQKPIIDREQAQALAEEFLKQIQPSHFKDLKLSEDYYPRINPNNGPKSFNYYRVVNDVPYRGNDINITVDTVNKTVLNYNLNWSDLDFPSLNGILNGKQANETLLKTEPLKLIYTQIMNPGQYDSTGDLRLVYQPTPASSSLIASNILDAKTGEFLDWQGIPVSKMMRAYRFTDIGDSFAEKEISILGQAGIFGEYQKTFHPDEPVTVISLLRALQALSNGYGLSGQSDEDVIKNAQQLGWLTEDIQPSSTINRESFTKLMLRYLKLENVAKLQGIYQSPYTDVNSNVQGYASLAKGIGMFNIEGDTFESSHTMTRSEAAYALVKALVFRS